MEILITATAVLKKIPVLTGWFHINEVAEDLLQDNHHETTFKSAEGFSFFPSNN